MTLLECLIIRARVYDYRIRLSGAGGWYAERQPVICGRKNHKWEELEQIKIPRSVARVAVQWWEARQN
jgi:hypothetical protein